MNYCSCDFLCNLVWSFLLLISFVILAYYFYDKFLILTINVNHQILNLQNPQFPPVT